jgi:hypothetical protein
VQSPSPTKVHAHYGIHSRRSRDNDCVAVGANWPVPLKRPMWTGDLRSTVSQECPAGATAAAKRPQLERLLVRAPRGYVDFYRTPFYSVLARWRMNWLFNPHQPHDTIIVQTLARLYLPQSWSALTYLIFRLLALSGIAGFPHKLSAALDQRAHPLDSTHLKRHRPTQRIPEPSPALQDSAVQGQKHAFR